MNQEIAEYQAAVERRKRGLANYLAREFKLDAVKCMKRNLEQLQEVKAELERRRHQEVMNRFIETLK